MDTWLDNIYLGEIVLTYFSLRVTQLRLINQQRALDIAHICTVALTYEKDAFEKASDKVRRLLLADCALRLTFTGLLYQTPDCKVGTTDQRAVATGPVHPSSAPSAAAAARPGSDGTTDGSGCSTRDAEPDGKTGNWATTATAAPARFSTSAAPDASHTPTWPAATNPAADGHDEQPPHATERRCEQPTVPVGTAAAATSATAGQPAEASRWHGPGNGLASARRAGGGQCNGNSDHAKRI